jgi:hypothetical protein
MALIFSTTSFAHDHSAQSSTESQAKVVTEVEVKEIASTEVKRVAATGKIDGDWASAPLTKITHVAKSHDWVVQFTRANSKDPIKKNLFVILTEGGSVKAVNYKGIQKMHSHGSGAAHSH